MRILVVDDAPLAEAIHDQWFVQGEGAIEITQTTWDELSARPGRIETDLIVYPSGLIGDLTRRGLLAPLRAEVRTDENLAFNDYLEHTRLKELSWRREVYAVSLGSPSLLVMYRRDVLEKLGKRPPETWQDYQELVAAAGDRAALAGLVAADGEWHAACEPGGLGWHARMLLARAASYAVQPSGGATLFDLATMAPRIESPAFVRALTELVAAKGVSREHAEPLDCLRALEEGRCALTIGWPTPLAAPTSGSSGPTGARPPLGCSLLPGTREWFDTRRGEWRSVEGEHARRVPLVAVEGRLLSCAKDARRRKLADHRMIWLAGQEWSRTLSTASASTGLARISQLGAVDAWTGPAFDEAGRREYREVLESLRERGPVLVVPRLPGRLRYLAALDEAVREALSGVSPGTALAHAAESWRAITAELGESQQIAAYADSLDL